jgi:hypothetical protein
VNPNGKNWIFVTAAAALVVVALVVTTQTQRAPAAPDAPAGYPRYTVGDTEGHNLIVTDNQTNTLYYYTIDKDAKVGSDLKLRGSVDLTQVGKPTIKPKTVKAGD